MTDSPILNADTVRLWRHPDDFDMAMAQRDQARREAEKYKRRWKKSEQKLAEVERMLGALIDGGGSGE
jgi:hypothetical protein